MDRDMDFVVNVIASDNYKPQYFCGVKAGCSADCFVKTVKARLVPLGMDPKMELMLFDKLGDMCEEEKDWIRMPKNVVQRPKVYLPTHTWRLCLPLSFRSEREFSDSYMSDSSGGDNTKINLRATVYRRDASPIVDGCGCYTCKNHTRAYINHLINVHEMLAHILLEIHNTHYYLCFFQKIREAIREGEFDMFCQEFIHGRRDQIAMAAMC